MINWSTFDLNLLRVLDAMFRERNTTRVGESIGLSQPAVSAALNRLRHALRDALFVREGNAMVPTPFAATLEEPLQQALERIQRTLSGAAAFDPARSTLRFRLLGDDFLAELLMPGLIATLLEQAPGIRVQLIATNPRLLSQQLAERTIDMAFWIPEETPDFVHRASALHASIVAVASKDNRAVIRSGVEPGAPFPLDLYCELPHVMFAPGGNLAGKADEGLAAIGRRRHVMLTMPDFFGVARVAAQTELIGTVPTRFAPLIAKRLGLSIYPLSYHVPLEHLFLYWHRRHTDDPEHRWLRERILALLEPFDELRHPASSPGHVAGLQRHRSRSPRGAGSGAGDVPAHARPRRK